MKQSCFVGSAPQQIKWSNDDCGRRFTKALNNFHEVMSRSSDSGGFKFTDIPSVIAVQK